MAAVTAQASLLSMSSPAPTPTRTSVRSTIQMKPTQLATPLEATAQVVRAAAMDFPNEDGLSSLLPTPDVPTSRMMADFLTIYGRSLKQLSASGDAVSAAGFLLLERIRVGVMPLLEQTAKSAEWEANEKELQQCLSELRKDLAIIQKYSAKQPNRMAVQMASFRCMQAAHILRRL